MIAEIGISGLLRQAFGFELHARPFFQLAEQFIAAQPQLLRRQKRTHRINAAIFKASAGFILEAFGAGFEIAGVDDQRFRREIAEQRRQRFVKEQRLPVFDPRRQRAFTDLLINMLGVALNLEAVAPLAAKQLDSGLVGRKFVRRKQVDTGDFLQRSLAVDVEQTQAIDLIIKKIETVGLLAAHREQIKQCAARGVLAVLHDLIDVTIAGAIQLRAQRIPRQPLAFFHHQRVAVEEIMRTDALHESADRDDQHAAFHGRELVQGGET